MQESDKLIQERIINMLPVESDFILEAELAYNLGLTPEGQVINAGEYDLYALGHVRFWFVELYPHQLIP